MTSFPILPLPLEMFQTGGQRDAEEGLLRAVCDISSHNLGSAHSFGPKHQIPVVSFMLHFLSQESFMPNLGLSRDVHFTSKNLLYFKNTRGPIPKRPRRGQFLLRILPCTWRAGSGHIEKRLVLSGLEHGLPMMGIPATRFDRQACTRPLFE